MTLEELLLQKRDAIKARWLQAVLESYPPDSRRFFKKQKDQFANPVGHAFSTELENLLQEIIEPSDPERLRASLDRIVRIRAVQEFAPSQGLSFLFLLKPIVREVVTDAGRDEDLQREMEALSTRIDGAVLAALDVYMTCREKLYILRADQMKNQVSALLRRAGLISEVPSWDAASEEGSENHPLNST
ncbi:MAG: RsbRD N-terminal domain-containing protein [Deltaproteobacteria bacterium]|nr:RsbRD N-terminal domain-containing protein [Deltaproteobacteria bacterium]